MCLILIGSDGRQVEGEGFAIQERDPAGSIDFASGCGTAMASC
jgi:hypothetical protein